LVVFLVAGLEAVVFEVALDLLGLELAAALGIRMNQ